MGRSKGGVLEEGWRWGSLNSEILEKLRCVCSVCVAAAAVFFATAASSCSAASPASVSFSTLVSLLFFLLLYFEPFVLSFTFVYIAFKLSWAC